MRVTYISWAPHCSRSDHTARELGGNSHMVYWDWLGSHPATIAFKYLGQSFSTWRILARERPEAVFVMSPPPVAILPVYLYCALLRVPFVIDAHTGAFMERWRFFQRVQFWLCRRAATTIVTNDHLAKLVNAHGGRTTIVPDVPVEFAPATASPDMATFTVVCVTSFDRDEPVAAMVEAARSLPDVRFLMTGNPSKAMDRLGGPLPSNLTLTGFVETSVYGALIRTAGVVMALTTASHTMQRGAYEAVYQGTPVIVSDNPLLRDAFAQGAIYVDNSPAAIVAAIDRVRRDPVAYRDAANRLRAEKMERWQGVKAALLAAVTAAAAGR